MYLYGITTAFLLTHEHSTKSALAQLPNYSVVSHLLPHSEFVVVGSVGSF